MYQINIMVNTDWEYFAQCDSKTDLDDIVRKLTYIRPDKAIQILEDQKELTSLDGSEYGYFVFKKRYIENEKLGYNYIKEFQKTIKK